ncbi:THO complex subunit 1, partial [Phenoliferia sp. Uapishka_3]
MAPKRRASVRKSSGTSPPPPEFAAPAAPSPPPVDTSASSPLTSLGSSSLPSPSHHSFSLSRPASTVPPQSTFFQFRDDFRQALVEVSRYLEERRKKGETKPLEQAKADELVDGIMNAAGRLDPEQNERWRVEARMTIIDKVLEEQLLMISLSPKNLADPPYDLMCDMIDIILTCSERGQPRFASKLADEKLPIIAISSLVDLQTIAGCHHIFNYIESRVERITKDMHPQKGKGPPLLRLLNELLRRLPKSKAQDVIFSGRILMFLSTVFPLGEKSGVNLRGNFNIGKETVWEEPEVKVEDEKTGDVVVKLAADDDDDVQIMEVVEEGAPTSPPKEDFYTTFWSLQRYFNNPPLLFSPASPSTYSTPSNTTPAPPQDHYSLFHTSLQKTLDVFAAATKSEKELSGAGKEKAVGAPAPLPGAGEEELEHYFFPKFLTSRKLLDLEISDPAFRRQILIQMLVVFQFLLSFTEEGRQSSATLPVTNKPALLSHKLSPANEKWITGLRAKTIAEMQSMEGGLSFTQTVELILKREQNWINWKLTNCMPFNKEPLPATTSKTAINKLAALTRKPKEFSNSLGNHVLTRLWNKNATSLAELQSPPMNETFDQIFREWKMTKAKLAQKRVQRKQLSESEGNKSSDVAMKLSAIDQEISNLDVVVKALHWRGVQSATTSHLKLIGHTRADDLEAFISAAMKPPPSGVKVESSEVKEEELVSEAEKEATKYPGTPKRPRGDEDVEIMEGQKVSKKVKGEE